MRTEIGYWRSLLRLAVGLLALMPSLPSEAASNVRAAVVAGIAAYNSGDYSTAFRLLKSAADKGDSDAEVNLGYMYARGQAVAEDQAEAMRLYRLSADRGNGEGMNAIAYKYTHGTGVPIDIKKAVDWYCRAIQIGNPRAMTNLGILHAEGQVVSYDIGEARSLWRQAAKLGHANAMYNLAESLLQSPSSPADTKEGNDWMLRAALLAQPAAIGWLRGYGYQGKLPDPVDPSGLMALAPPKAPPGNAPECASV